ncbi:prolyl 4-hydroxylase subunit alpha-1-like isoform X2 [Drosophila biarmipes]|uniref:prolyl 4-hydroxylase subunit alpha-1-like isoform X2 n=1 Tax=Drosophila biarmipes TaxID=125945 RepID=UPI001CDA5D59|nr:prolyl 4-hydroxylase subunit alpha-1-like isoform X2 [Drosophila biarmipes]
MVKMFLLFLVLTFSVVLEVKAVVVSAPESYDFAISSESQLSLLKLKETQINNLQNYNKVLKSQLKKVKLAIKYSEDLLRTPAHNLLFGFKVLRHLYKDWPEYFNILKRELGSKEILISQDLLMQQPTSVDFEESLGAIYRLQTVYNLDSYDMAEGILDGKDYNVKKWSIDECLILGLMYQYLKHYNESENWLQLALYYYQDHPNPEELKVKLWEHSNLLESLMEANKGLGRYLEAKKFAKDLLSILPNHSYTLKQLSKLEFLQANPIKLTKTKKDHQLQKEICSKRYRKRSSNLVCRYVDWNPFLELAPLKMEELSMETHISIFHGFLGNKDIESLKNASRPKLQRNKHLSWNCTCKIANLSSSSHDIARKINDLIIDITGFPRLGNQMLEVINYGIAGNYNPDDTAKFTSHNQANALIFLSDAEKGGEIVFPSRQIKVKPRKGSMLVWVNLKDSVIYHQCPILKGNMWVANKVLN